MSTGTAPAPGPKKEGRPFVIRGADGENVEVKAGEYYFNTKERCRRLMLDSLSSGARQVYAFLELATMGFKREDAVVKDKDSGKYRHARPSDAREATGHSKQNVRLYLHELEKAGLAQRVVINGGNLKTARKGHVKILSWAEPKEHFSNPLKTDELKEKVVARYYLPPWFPAELKALRGYIKRKKLQVRIDEVVARNYLSEMEVVERALQNAEKVVARLAERICARPPEGAPEASNDRAAEGSPKKPLIERLKERAETTTTLPSDPTPSSSSSSPDAPPTEWTEGLARVFHEAGKPVPLPKQSLAAYWLVFHRWQEFLRWLPASNEFRRMKHPGGLPTLVQMFEATQAVHAPPAVPVREEERPARWENEGMWIGDKHHWDELSEDMRVFYREMFPDEVPSSGQ